MTGVTALGDRVATLLGERGMSQAALGAALSTRRRQSWVSGVISGRFRPSFEDAKEIADHLGVTPMWLIYGDHGHGDTEFVARMRVIDGDLDERGRYMVIRMAEEEAAQARSSRMSATDDLVQRLTALGVDPRTIEQAFQSPAPRPRESDSALEADYEAGQGERARG